MVDFANPRQSPFTFFVQIVLEFFAPTLCCHCGKVGLLLCAKCFSQITYTPLPHTVDSGTSCIPIFTVAQYDGPIRSLITSMKFLGVKAVCNYLADLAIYTTSIPPFDIICPIPLHPKRKNERGFDQVELIASKLAKHLQKPCVPLLVRTKYLTAQSSVSNKQQRFARMHDIYKINEKYSQKVRHIYPIKILLVDDVFTTGATIISAAQTLNAHNPHLVISGLCIARD